MNSQRISSNGQAKKHASLQLNLEVRDPDVIKYLSQFDDDRDTRTLEVLKAGVIAIQSASPTLDTRVVDERLDKLIGPSSEVRRSQDELARRLNELARRLDELMRSVDPNNKKSGLAVHKNEIANLVKSIAAELSLDKPDSAMSRLLGQVYDLVEKAIHTNGVKVGEEKNEAERGHLKGRIFEADLYEYVAEKGGQLGDETESVGDRPGLQGRKFGDYCITLGEATGAPGKKLVIEVKNKKACTLKAAQKELQHAKKNRSALCGIAVFAKGCEPSEIGNLRRIGDDLFCTVETDALNAGEPLLFLDAAIEIARVQMVIATRKGTAGTLDLERINQHVEALVEWVEKTDEFAKNARAIKVNGEKLENGLGDMKADMRQRLTQIAELLRLDPAV